MPSLCILILLIFATEKKEEIRPIKRALSEPQLLQLDVCQLYQMIFLFFVFFQQFIDPRMHFFSGKFLNFAQDSPSIHARI